MWRWCRSSIWGPYLGRHFIWRTVTGLVYSCHWGRRRWAGTWQDSIDLQRDIRLKALQICRFADVKTWLLLHGKFVLDRGWQQLFSLSKYNMSERNSKRVKVKHDLASNSLLTRGFISHNFLLVSEPSSVPFEMRPWLCKKTVMWRKIMLSSNAADFLYLHQEIGESPN